MMSMGNDAVAATIEQLLADLDNIYNQYAAKNAQEASEKRPDSLFAKWFNIASPDQAMHQAFMSDVERCTAAIAQTLAPLKQSAPAHCQEYAHRALHVLFAPKPKEEQTDFERYLAIVEYYGAALFPYASLDELERIHREQLERTPRRRMFPKQLETLQALERMISVRSTPNKS